MQTSTLAIEQLAALQQFAAAQGRRWKSELRHAWETGDYPSDCDSASLQQVRNTFGPSWLVRFQFSKASAASAAQGKPVARMEVCPGVVNDGVAGHMMRDACYNCAPYWEQFPVCPTHSKKLTRSGYCQLCRKFYAIPPKLDLSAYRRSA